MKCNSEEREKQFIPWKMILCASTNQIWRAVLGVDLIPVHVQDTCSYDNLEHVFALMYVQCRKEWNNLDVATVEAM